MIWQLAWRNLTYRPWRTLLLLVGYGVGVAVMITLLAVGEAMLTQAREEKLVGGGQITVLPDGIDLEVLKTGGLGGMFFSVPNARFVYLQVLASPRLASVISSVAPQLENKLLYLSTADGTETPVRASGELPDATRAVGGGVDLLHGAWHNDAADNRWAHPTAAELRHDLDHFHIPPADVQNRDSWGEWHYFNVLSDDASRWYFISFIVGGDVPDGEWGGQLLVTQHERGKAARRFSALVPSAQVRFSTRDADLQLGDAEVAVAPNGDYVVVGKARAERGSETLSLDLRITPADMAYFPGTTLLSGAVVSGYTVPALRATASGSVCVESVRCDRFEGARAYHDHNWGVWRGVTWEWGSARAGSLALLFGQVQPPDSLRASAPLFVYVTDSLGFVSLFRPERILYEDGRTVSVDGQSVRVPSRATFAQVRGDDSLQVELIVDDAVATDTRLARAERGETADDRAISKPWFVQMQGRVRIRMRIRGVLYEATGTGFFETYRPD